MLHGYLDLLVEERSDATRARAVRARVVRSGL